MKEARRSPYTWVTWLSPLLAGDASCWFAAWFHSHFKITDAIEDTDFDLAMWRTEHTLMVEARASELRDAGWTVTVEDQNFFTLRGRVGTLSGKPDIVATKEAAVLVVDCKGGARKAGDVIQVLEYMFALPLASKRYDGKRIAGQVQYRSGSIEIPPERFTDELKARLIKAMNDISGPNALTAVPSARECAKCNLPKTHCAARVESEPAVAEVAFW